MSVTLRPFDFLSFPFRGAQLIEASAGTGKTWTLTSLYLRLILGDGPTGLPLRPPEILVMTFTDAATQELRDRIRRRLAEAAAFFRDRPVKQADATLIALREQRPVAGWIADAQQFETAGQWMDDAAIHTIHGWCSRMLRQHAFDSGSLFEQQRAPDPAALLAAVTRDYWRHWIYGADPHALRGLTALPASPDALLKAIRPRLDALDRAPEAQDLPQTADPTQLFVHAADWVRRRDAAERRARELWRTHIDAIETQLREAMATQLSGTNYPSKQREVYLSRMRAWCDGDTLDTSSLQRFGRTKLVASTKKGCTPPADTTGAFAAVDAVVECGSGPPVDALLDHASRDIRARLAARKRQLAQFDFQDLLQRLYQALHRGDSGLARAIRRQYPVALVDEFQDTDPWQYGSLTRIYIDPHPDPAALVMIGDPKQAIYRFRGADLDTYLAAREMAQGIHTLTGNYRSTPGLVAALNDAYGTATAPFGAMIAYEAVTARRGDVLPLATRDGTALPALTVWTPANPAAQTAGALRLEMTEGFATQIVALLNAGIARPADIAVLVRSGREARRIRLALEARGVRSVYLSDRESVYATDEAQDLWCLLRAVATPRSVGAIRAALSTRSFGFEFDELDRLFADDDAFEREAEAFARWQQLWQQQGLLAMLYAVLHEQQIPARLQRLEAEGGARDGERRLTNLLHLGDLLQRASLALQGEVAVVRFLAEQLRAPAARDDAAQMRLETDADLVKVVTVHKAKGLEYPVVFVPFAYEYRALKRDEIPAGADLEAADEIRVAEDGRLLYVAFTRAERALFVGAATRSQDFAAKRPPKSALARLLGRRSEEDLLASLERWSACTDIHVAALPAASAAMATVTAALPAPRAAAVPLRRHDSRWRSTSFSALTRGLAAAALPAMPLPGDEGDERYGDAQVDNPQDPADPEPGPASTAAAPGFAAFPAGAKYGDLLHGLLEWQLKAGWPILQKGLRDSEDAAWLRLLHRRGELLGLDAGQQALLADWIAAIARCPLGLEAASGAATPVSLSTLPPSQTWAEMGFVITTQGVDAAAIDRRVQQQILPGRTRDALMPLALEGLLTGFLDLVFEHGGRYYVLDYKSNRLDDYTPKSLDDAILQHRYDLQYTLYLVALHRLLCARLPHYDYDSHMGGSIYVFARGIGSPGDGIYRDCPPRSLIESLDSAFRESVQ